MVECTGGRRWSRTVNHGPRLPLSYLTELSEILARRWFPAFWNKTKEINSRNSENPYCLHFSLLLNENATIELALKIRIDQYEKILKRCSSSGALTEQGAQWSGIDYTSISYPKSPVLPSYHLHEDICLRVILLYRKSVVVLFLPRPSNRVRKCLCKVRSSNYHRIQSTRRSRSFYISWRQSIYIEFKED